MKNFFNKIIDWFNGWKSIGDENPTAVTYSVKEYTTSNYNVLGEKINTKTMYFICKTITWVDYTSEYGLCIYKGKQLDNCQLVRWTHGTTSVNRTYFDTKEDAEKKLNDILTNPNKYIVK